MSEQTQVTAEVANSDSSGRPRGRFFSAQDLALIAAFAALTVVLGLAPPVSIPGTPVPFTFQHLGVSLCGAILGWKRGSAAIALMLAVGLLGVPVLAGGRSTVAALAGPTVGYLVGFIIGAAVIGAMVQSRLPKVEPWWIALSCVVGGIVVMHALGIPYAAVRTRTSLWAQFVLHIPFFPGDLLKAAVATAVATAVHRGVPGLTPALRRGR
ncbi:biotin transport system substrate-specific component [Austwickia chelonae]|uniref:Biotin transporter n=1 Tax=Austwickia chelonae NBRC 105200 TaxID=1184607 RepID=K6VMZ7_9MICO|nr:biotin transporter BioY [Austwickia chelonae]GAB78079.1 BioY family protein [Austwickia chelonae NBRC 105200]SEV95911.1 biotin transport system substrate-specific component [Austwickia chelonae]